MTDHEHCWHAIEIDKPKELQRCCWCDSRRTVAYAPPTEPHGRYAYR